MIHLTVGHLHLAGAAQAMAAGMRDVDALAQRGVEQGLAVLDLDRGAQRFDGELMTHDAVRCGFS